MLVIYQQHQAADIVVETKTARDRQDPMLRL